MSIGTQTQPECSEHTATDTVTDPRQKQEVSVDADMAARRQKNEAARLLLQEWLRDDSGYDEEVWPKVKQIIEDNRLSPRKRFCD
jgi:hypothetical protein